MKKLLLAAAAAALPGLMAAQETAGPQVFRETVEVRVMDLDVVVTDSKGNPIPDLKKDDFRVRVDGRPVPIDYFTRVQEGAIHAPDLANASPDRVLAEYRKGEEAYVPRHFLVYVDIGHLSPGTRGRAVEALRDLVTRLGPSDTARVVMFDRRGKTMSEWTSSKETLLEALSRVQNAGVGMSRLMTEQQTLRQIDSTGSRSSRASLARMYAEQERAEVRNLLKDMDAELSTLTALPGKKIFLYVSGGFETQPGYAMVQYAVGSFSLQSIETQSMGPFVEALAKKANATDVTFYTVDARGINGEGGLASDDEPLAMRPGVAFVAREESQAGLKNLAQLTGGAALVNTNDLQRGLARVYLESSTYYSVGVNVSKLPNPTGYHDVRVDVSRSGVTVLARRGFSPRSATDRGRDVAQAALRSNVGYKAIPVDLKIAASHKAKKYYELPILVTVPASSLTFIPEGDKSRAVAEFYIGAMDDSGNTSDIGREEAVFVLPRDAPPDTALKQTVTLQMRKGPARVVVNVRDRETGKMGTAKADVVVD
jgi:VWFA-related protein